MRCPNCGEKCVPYLVNGDFDYEYGSIKGTHRPYDPYWACDMCDEPLPNFVPGERESYLGMDR